MQSTRSTDLLVRKPSRRSLVSTQLSGVRKGKEDPLPQAKRRGLIPGLKRNATLSLYPKEQENKSRLIRINLMKLMIRNLGVGKHVKCTLT